MPVRADRRLFFASIVFAALTVSTPETIFAQKKKTAAPPSTGSPVLNFPLPLGCQPGVTQELTLTGSNLQPAESLWTSFPAKVELIEDDKAAAEGKVRVRLTAEANVPLGLYPIRVLSESGLSNFRLFAVDDLPQVVDNDGNRDKSKAQEITPPCVVSGRIEAESGDYYKINVKPGQRLSVEILGRRLGSPIDPTLSIFAVKNGREVAHDNDSPGCQGDPRLSHVFKEGGEYLIEVRDVLGRGGADYVYRMRVGDFPLATSPVPMAAKAGSKVQVHFAGPMIDGVKPVDVAVPNESGAVVWVVPKSGGASGWPVPLIVSDVEEIVEKEPNQKADQATRIPVPGGATGRLLPGDAVDDYVVSLKKGQKIAIEGHTLEWGSPSLLYITVKNAKTGAELAKSNAAAAPPADQRLEFTAPDDGDFVIEVQHLLYQGGPAEVYHLSVRPVAPALEVVLNLDMAEAAAGVTAYLPFSVIRKNFAGPVEVRVRGDGSVPPVKLKANQTVGVLQIPSKGDAAASAKKIVVEATAIADGKAFTAVAHAKPSVSGALAGLVFPPLDLPGNALVAVKGKPPFSLSAKLDPPDAVPGSAPNVVVTATREPGFDTEIAINAPFGLPANAGAKVAPIAKGKSEVKFPLDVNAKVAPGEYFLLISGKAKLDKREAASDPTLLPLLVGPPFDLAVEPANIEIVVGEKAKFKLTAKRKHGYKGPIAIEIKNLPANVAGGKATLNPDQNAIDIELTTDAKAAPVERVELEIIGSATAMNNLQGAAPPLSLRIKPKQ